MGKCRLRSDPLLRLIDFSVPLLFFCGNRIFHVALVWENLSPKKMKLRGGSELPKKEGYMINEF